MKHLIAALALVILASSTAVAGHGYVVGMPIVAAPVAPVDYFAPTAVPVYAAYPSYAVPYVAGYAPYAAAYVPTYTPYVAAYAAPVYAAAPVAVYPYGARVVTKVYPFGQPVRNIVRAIVP